jgi:hypothetical protein
VTATGAFEIPKSLLQTFTRHRFEPCLGRVFGFRHFATLRQQRRPAVEGLRPAPVHLQGDLPLLKSCIPDCAAGASYLLKVGSLAWLQFEAVAIPREHTTF